MRFRRLEPSRPTLGEYLAAGCVDCRGKALAYPGFTTRKSHKAYPPSLGYARVKNGQKWPQEGG